MNCNYCKKEYVNRVTKSGQLSKTKQTHCSAKCRQLNSLLAYGRIKIFNVPSGTVGAIGEYAVSVDLLKKGYEVYKSMSPSCSGDLAIEKDKKLIKIEVRTGYKHIIDGRVNFSGGKDIRSEVLALYVQRTDEIIYMTYPNRKEFIL